MLGFRVGVAPLEPLLTSFGEAKGETDPFGVWISASQREAVSEDADQYIILVEHPKLHPP